MSTFVKQRKGRVMLSTDLNGQGVKIMIVGTRWNPDIVMPMVEQAVIALQQYGVDADDIDHATAPGAFELPLATLHAARSGHYDVVIAFGCVIRGETAHFEYVAGEAARGITAASLETGIPIMFGVLTTENRQQATDRAFASGKNKGAEIAADAIAMANLVTALSTKETKPAPPPTQEKN